jgi:hypothetical protein
MGTLSQDSPMAARLDRRVPKGWLRVQWAGVGWVSLPGLCCYAWRERSYTHAGAHTHKAPFLPVTDSPAQYMWQAPRHRLGTQHKSHQHSRLPA